MIKFLVVKCRMQVLDERKGGVSKTKHTLLSA